MSNYTVYMHVSPSNKRYIGITSLDINRRWRKNGKGYKHQQYFYRAIKKYGWDNFQHIIVAKGLDEETAKWLEVELIREFDTTNQDNGYNISLGGNTGNGLRGEDHPNYNRPMLQEQKDKISKTRIENGVAKGENNPNYGKHLSEESIKKMKDTKNNKPTEEKNEINKKISKARIEKGVAKGKNNPSAKTIICLTTKEIFYTMKDASEKYNCCDTGISMCCKGKRNYNGKLSDGTPLVWKYITIIEL